MPVSQEKNVLILGPAGQLEAVVTDPTAPARPMVAIVCHPDPTQRGTMNNKVVTTVAQALGQLGLLTVRFNYRGVGNSEGAYGQVVGEIEDLRAVLVWVQQQWSQYAIWLVGFSFGSFIAASVANKNKNISQLICIAPAVDRRDFNKLTHIECPWLVVASDADEIIPFAQVEPWLAHPPSPLESIIVSGASHFFHGRLIELRELLKQHLSE